MSRVVAAPGTRFGMLTYLGESAARTSDNHLRGYFRCDCGENYIGTMSRVVGGVVKSWRKPLCIVDTPLGRMAVVDYGPLIGITPEAARRRLKKGKLEGCRQVSP